MWHVGTSWTIEPLPALVLAGFACTYGLGVHRLRQRNRTWQWTRWVPFLLGLLCIAVATMSPLEAQDTKRFSAHVIQHLLLSMAAPPLLCLGAPITLALQASGRNTQTRLLSVLHSRVVRMITFPVVSWGLFVITLFVLYYSGLYELSLRHTFFHDAVHAHFILSGFLFFSPVIAIDPHPWRMPHGLRLLYVATTLPVHAFLALALMSASSPIALDWYLQTTGRSADAILTDQKLGSAIMWIASDFLAISIVGIVATQWARDDERNADREDRFVELGQHSTSSAGSSAITAEPTASP